MQGKVLRFRSSTLTMGNLAMIFKPDINQGIYICSEEEGEIIIPSETGVFNVEDYDKTYKSTKPEMCIYNVTGFFLGFEKSLTILELQPSLNA